MSDSEIVLEIRNFRIVSDARIDLSKRKVILYGPNAGGKSTVIYSLLNLAGVKIHDNELEGEIKVLYGDSYLKLYRKDRDPLYLDAKIGSYSVNERLRDSPEAFDAIKGFWGRLGVKSVAHVDRDTLYIYDLTGGSKPWLELHIDDYDEWEDLMKDPNKVFLRVDDGTLYSYIEDILSDEVSDIYVMPRLRKGKWIVWSSLAYGYRRAVAMMISLLADAITIEGFDNGLHIDLMFKVLSILGDSNKLIVIETHSGSIISKTLGKWDIYYMEGGKAEKITLDKLRDTWLYRKELEAYKIY